MSIKASCGSCGKTYSLNEKYAGKRLPCKECGEPFQVGPADDFEDFEDEFDPAPRRPRRSAAPPPRRGAPKRRSAPPAKRPRKKTKKKRRSSGPNGAVIGISAGVGVVAIALMVVLMLTAFGDSPESLLKEMLATLEEMAETMEGIEDADSAKAAVPKIERIGDRLVSIGEKMLEAGDSLSEEEEKVLEEKYKDRLAEVQRRLSKASFRIRRIEGVREVLQEPLVDLGRKMQEVSRKARERNNKTPEWML